MSNKSLTVGVGKLINLESSDTVSVGSFSNDIDSDGISDFWEQAWDLQYQDFEDALIDTDKDGLVNRREFELGINPRFRDTDEDGLTDGDEAVVYWTSPVQIDSDSDGFSDLVEIKSGSDPNKPTEVPYHFINNTWVMLNC